MWGVPVNSNYILCLYQWGMRRVMGLLYNSQGLTSTWSLEYKRELCHLRPEEDVSLWSSGLALSEPLCLKQEKQEDKSHLALYWLSLFWSLDQLETSRTSMQTRALLFDPHTEHIFTQPLPKNRFGSNSVLEKCKFKLYFSGG